MDPLSDQIVKALRTAPPEGLQLHELVALLGADVKLRHRVRAQVATLIDDGTVEKVSGSRVRLAGLAPKSRFAATGLLRLHPHGFGFVTREDGLEDVHVPARHRGAAIDGDRVGLTTWPTPKGTEGRVEAVLGRGRRRITGTVRGRGKAARLIPDDPRILAAFPEVHLDGEAPRHADALTVAARITHYPEHDADKLVVKVELVLGRPESLPTEVERILVNQAIDTDFPPEVQTQADAVPQTIDGDRLEADGRLDLRALQFITIDPETARDFDDAVCVEDSPRPGCDRLWVAVADVSHYVWPETPLDEEARHRGCSVYLPDRAIPMLPKALSSGICSLNPDVDRFAMVARMEVDAEGAVHDEFFCAAAIRSKARFDYGGVARALAHPDRAHGKYLALLPYLQRLQRVSARLRARRMQRGSLDFDLPEAKVVLDQDDPERVRDIIQSRADPEVKGAYQLVEDFMLAANEAVARCCREHGRDTLWRVHAPPAEQRLALFSEVAASFGVKVDVDEARDPKRLRDVLARLALSSAAAPLSTLLLRSLKQAQYDIVNVGHFGLAAPDYVHFTSPIRRYPDLVVHRVLKQILAKTGGASGGAPPPVDQGAELQRVAQASSAAERRAMEAEREVVDLYRAHFMRDRIGEEFEGTIGGVTSFGLFVSIDSPFVEGLVRTETMRDDRYHFEEHRLRLVGTLSGRSFSLGQRVKVRIDAVSVPRRKIDLSLLDVEAAPVDEFALGEVTEWEAQEAEYEQARLASQRVLALGKQRRVPARGGERHGSRHDAGGAPSGPRSGKRADADERSTHKPSGPKARHAAPTGHAKAGERSGRHGGPAGKGRGGGKEHRGHGSSSHKGSPRSGSSHSSKKSGGKPSKRSR